MARNIVALTRSKGLCVLLLPSTQEFRFSFLHTLRTLCAYRHGLYHVGSTPPDLDRLATFLSLPDATFNSEPCIFNQGSWLLTHQISYFGTWDFLPLAMQLSHEGQIYILTLCLRSDLPQPDHWEVSAGHFNWHEYREGPPPLELFLVFGEDCLHLTTGNNNLASFDLPQRNSTPVPLTNNGWTLSPTTGAYFFARSSVSVGHLFPSAPATDDPFRLPRPNVVLWPNQTPAIYSNPLPPTTLSDTHPPPQGLPSSAAVLYQLGLTEMLSPNILLCPALNPYDWMVAYSALTLPHFCTDHLSVLQNPQVLDAFDAKIRQPLLSGQLDAVAAHFIALLPPPPSTFTEQPWILHSKTRKPPASTLPPNDDNIVQDTPSHVAKSPFHLDNIHAAVANLASLLANADDLPKSPKGWIKVAILPTYAGKGVPGNFDSNTQEIVSNGVLTVVSYGIHKPLSENLIAALVAFDNRKRRMRFDIGHFTPGRSQSAQLVIRLSPSSVPHPIGGPGRPSGSSLLAHFPLLPNNALPYAIYFCPAQARQVILRDGIRPKRKSSSSTSSAVKVLPSPTPDPFSIVGGHPLRGNTDACIVLDIHKMLTDNISFVVHSADNCYGTDTVPLPTRYFAAAFTFTPFGVQQNWLNPGSSQHVQHSSRPKYVPPTHSVAEAVRSTAADVRLQSTFSRSLPNQPADDDTEMSGPTIEGEIAYSAEVETALDRLLYAIDHPPFIIDEEHYIALSQLPLTYPWPSITIDLRPYVPFFERHLVAHLLSGRCGLLPVDVPAHTILDAWLKLLSEAIVHGIFDLHHAAYTPPPLPGLLTHPRFWHAHLNHACTRAVSPLAGAGTTDNMAGDQLAIWNQVSVGSNAPIPSTHLTIFVPPALGAFILANLKSPQGESPQLRPVTPSQPHSSSVLTASRPFHLDLPVIYPEHEDLIMDNARQAAATGFIRPESIPLLAITDESFYRGKLSWTLRFPVPAPDPSGSARRFSSTVTFQQGPHSAEALEGALRLASPFSYGNEASHVLFNCPFLRLPDLSTLRPGPRIESYETPTPPEAAVIEWLNNRAPRLIPSRHRTYIPVPFRLVDYFNSHIHLPQVAMLIASHQCHNEAATAEARKHKRNYSCTDFLRVIPADTVMSGNLLPPPPSPSPTPENLPRTALAPSQPNLHPRPSQASTIAQPAPSSHLAPTRPQHLPPTGPCSDPKRPRIPGTDSAPSTIHPGPMPSSLDSTRPVGSSAPSSHRSSRGPYTKGKDAATGMADTFKGKGSDKGFTGKDTYSSSWPPLTPGPPKGFAKNSPGGSHKGAAKGPEKGKFQGKGIAPPTVFAPPANFSAPGPPGRP